MDILSGLKKDIEEGIKQGVDAFKSTATLVKEKAEELTEKGKTQYLIYELKNKGQKQRAALGEKLRRLVKTKKVNVSNEDLKKLLSAIDRTDEAIAKLEGKDKKQAMKKPAQKTAPAKESAASKKAAPAARKKVAEKKKPTE